MSDYKNIRGKKVKFLTTDLSGEQSEGQIFYSDTDNDFKTVISTAAWSAGGNMLTARRLFASSASCTQTAAFGAGGYIDGTGDQNSTEEYNGSGFSAGGNIGTARREFDGAGTLTAGLIMG